PLPDRLRLLALHAAAGRPASFEPPPAGPERARALAQLARNAAASPSPETLVPLLDRMRGAPDADAARARFAAALARRAERLRFELPIDDDPARAAHADRLAALAAEHAARPRDRARALLVRGLLRLRAEDLAGAQAIADDLAAGASPEEREAADRLRRRIAVRTPPADGDGAESFMDGSVRHYPAGGDRALVWFLHAWSSVDRAMVARTRDFLAGHGIALVTVRDSRGMAGLDGWGDHAGDRAGAVRALAGILRAQGYRRHVATGNSMSGSSAIWFAVETGALGALVINAFAGLPRREEVPGRLNQRRLDRLVARTGTDLPELDRALAGLPGFVLHLHHSDSSPLYRLHVDRFGALPQARLFAHGSGDDGGHLVARLHAPDRLAGTYLPFLADCGLVAAGG
ncbi:MAG: hypothetical protein D6686_17415, partial [Alphaproteobacteria bacterium]